MRILRRKRRRWEIDRDERFFKTAWRFGEKKVRKKRKTGKKGWKRKQEKEITGWRKGKKKRFYWRGLEVLREITFKWRLKKSGSKIFFLRESYMYDYCNSYVHFHLSFFIYARLVEFCWLWTNFEVGNFLMISYRKLIWTWSTFVLRVLS